MYQYLLPPFNLWRITRGFPTQTGHKTFKKDGETTYLVAEKVYTLDPEKPIAKAVKVQGECISEVYTHDQWEALLRGSQGKSVKDRTQRLQGFLYPGFHECHMHPLLDGILRLMGADLRDVYSEADLIEAMQAQLVKQLPDPTQITEKVTVVGYNIDPLTQSPIASDTWLEALNKVSQLPSLKQVDGYRDQDKVYCVVEHNSMHIWYVNSNLLEAIFQSNPQLLSDPNLETYFPKKNGQFTGVVQEDTGIAALLGTLQSQNLVQGNFSDLVKAATAITVEAQNQGCTTIAEAMLGSIAGDLAAYEAASAGSLGSLSRAHDSASAFRIGTGTEIRAGKRSMAQRQPERTP